MDVHADKRDLCHYGESVQSMPRIVDRLRAAGASTNAAGNAPTPSVDF
jgi:hypothetical protein